MKLIILKESLLEALNSVEKSTGGNNLPVLKNVKLEANKDNSIKFTTTDLEIAVEHEISSKVIKEGSIITPFSLFNDVIRNLRSEKIQIDTKDNKLLLSTDNYDASFFCGDIDDFPLIPYIEEKIGSFSIKKEIFHKILSQSILATQYSDIRPEINGIFFNFDGNNMFTVGTDSFRLLEKKINKNNIEIDNQKEFNFTVPLKTVESLLKVFNSNEDDIEILFDNNQIIFKSESIKVISRLIEGKFPDYKNIIPKDTNQEIHLNKNNFIDSIKTTKSFSGQTNDIVFESKDGKNMEIYSGDSSIGESVYRLPIKTKGEFNDFSITFNWKFILEGIKAFEGDDIILGISESDKPVIIKSIEENDIIYVVMPIRS